MTYRNGSTPQGNAQAHRTPKQAAFLAKLILSSCFTDAEAQRTRIWLATPKATIAATSALIDKAQRRIDTRNAQRKASEERRGQYHRAKQSTAAATPAAQRPQPAAILFHPEPPLH